MQTKFTASQLKDPEIAEANKILRNCVHCGFCTATCPTYMLLGDERDSPRGRIYMIKEMLERDQPASPEITTHIDRCLSCLSCMSTCPSGVNYMHLVDQARIHIEKTHTRPFRERALRFVLSAVLPNPDRFRLAARLGRPFKIFARLLKHYSLTRPLGAMLQLVPKGRLAPAITARQIHHASGGRDPKARVILHPGCAQQVLRPEINDATIRVLARIGIEVIIPENPTCCGALVHHMGRKTDSLTQARANIDRWQTEMARYEIAAIITNASGCGTMVKDYGFMLRGDPVYAKQAKQVSALSRDISEFLVHYEIPKGFPPEPLTVAYQSACSLQHGQQVHKQPMSLLSQANYKVISIPENHICCGSAGVYNITQAEISDRLLDRKLNNINSVKPDVIATGNIGCITQLSKQAEIPVVHTVELIDWATGGPAPAQLQARNGTRSARLKLGRHETE